MLAIQKFGKHSPQFDNSIRETQGLSSTIFLKSENLRDPTPSLWPVSPVAVGQDGHFNWQAVSASKRMLRGRNVIVSLVFVIDFSYL